MYENIHKKIKSFSNFNEISVKDTYIFKLNYGNKHRVRILFKERGV